jgi:hypothetical protein
VRSLHLVDGQTLDSHVVRRCDGDLAGGDRQLGPEGGTSRMHEACESGVSGQVEGGMGGHGGLRPETGGECSCAHEMHACLAQFSRGRAGADEGLTSAGV